MFDSAATPILLQGDALARLAELPDSSVDLVLCDPPYGTTACAWDSVIPFEAMWEQVWRVLRANRAAVLFGHEPFSSALRMSAVGQFKYDWYWQKSRPSGFTNVRLKPLKDVEVISVFSHGTTANRSPRNMVYNPQGVAAGVEWKRPERYKGQEGIAVDRSSHALTRKTHGSNYPRQVLAFSNPNRGLVHPTQKPVDLMEYLARTYSHPGETVLDFTMGSGTTGVACANTGRRFIGIERDEGFFEIARERIKDAELEGMLA